MPEKYRLYDTSPYENKNVHEMLREFHTHFGIGYEGNKRVLSVAEFEFRLECHREEAKEYFDAALEGNLVGQLDALTDELYFLAGTAHRMGLNMAQLNIIGDKVPYSGPPRALPKSDLNVRLNLHDSCVRRFEDLVHKDADMDSLYKALALAIHTFTYTALLHGFDIDEATRRVHAANMAKNVDPAKQRRRALLKEQGHDVEHMMEITKPDDWLPPYLGDLVGEGPYIEDVTPTGADPLVINGVEVLLDIAPLCGLITIDGPDASGKTTLAKRIAEVTGGEYIHLTWSKQLAQVMDQYRVGAINYAGALATDRVVVLERPWLSHVVYSDAYRGGDFDADDVLHWKGLTEKMASLNIMALPSNREEWLKLYLEMCASREELHGSNAVNALNVFDGFWRAFQHADDDFFPQNVEVYDINHVSTLDIDQYIYDYVLPKLKTKEIL